MQIGPYYPVEGELARGGQDVLSLGRYDAGSPTMRDLEAARDIAGVVRVRRLDPTAHFDLDTRFTARLTSRGHVLLLPVGRPHALVLDSNLRLRLRIEVPEAVSAQASSLCEERDLFAVAGTEALTMLDERGKALWSLPYPVALAEPPSRVTCHFSTGGSLFWMLLPTGVYRQRGDTLFVIDPSCGRVLEEREVRLALGEGPAWSIHGPHPVDTSLFLEGGMGQEGTLSVLATFKGGRLTLGQEKRSVTFVAYGDGGATYASLSHLGRRLDWDHYPSRAPQSSRDLSRLFEELEDSHAWTGLHLGGGRLLVPSSEGRLFVVDPEDEEVTELRLNGDERNWNWSTVLLVGSSLVTARVGDQVLTAWDLS